MYDMSITQYVSKVVPYPDEKYNLDRQGQSEDDYIGEVSNSDNPESKYYHPSPKKKGRVWDSLFYNLVQRDQCNIEK